MHQMEKSSRSEGLAKAGKFSFSNKKLGRLSAHKKANKLAEEIFIHIEWIEDSS